MGQMRSNPAAFAFTQSLGMCISALLFFAGLRTFAMGAGVRNKKNSDISHLAACVLPSGAVACRPK